MRSRGIESQVKCRIASSSPAANLHQGYYLIALGMIFVVRGVGSLLKPVFDEYANRDGDAVGTAECAARTVGKGTVTEGSAG